MIKSFVRDKILLRNKMLHDFPYLVNIEPTPKCNLSCKMCPHSTMKDHEEDMDIELFKRVINQVSEFADRNTTITPIGLGELLLYSKPFDAIRYIKKTCPNSKISFATNGTLLNNTTAKNLTDLLDEKDGLLISLNVNNRDEYKQLMGADKFEQVTENIKRLLAIENRKLPVTVQFLDTHNGEGIEQFREYWQPYLTGRDRIYIRPLVNWNGAIDMGSFPVQAERNRCPCTALWNTISVDKSGNVYPCCEGFASRKGSDLLFGNINEKPLIDLYNDRIHAIRKKHLAGEWDDIPTCKNCSMWAESPDIWLKFGGRYY